MTEIEKVCGNCANHCSTSKHGGKGGAVMACRPEVMAWRKSIEGARLFTRDYKGYGPRHHCHRHDDFERKAVG